MYQLIRKWKTNLQRELKQIPWIYVPYYHLAKFRTIPRRHLVSRDTDLCLEGYPSSATSYLNVVLHHIRPDLKIAHHTHSIANLRIALQYQKPIVVTLRDPEQSVASTAVRFGGKIDSLLLDKILLDYSTWYRFVLDHQEQICVIPFPMIVDNLPEALGRISSQTGIDFSTPDLAGMDKEVRIYMKVWNHEYGEEGNISLPNEERDQLKSKILDALKKSNAYPEACDVYEILIEHIDKPS